MGTLLYYKVGISRADITKIQNRLFGKVLTQKTKKYYYPGAFAHIEMVKIANGCYYCPLDLTVDMELLTLCNTVQCDIPIMDNLISPEASKKIQYTDIPVKHLNC